MAHREKFLCPGCNTLGYEKRHGVCPTCADDVQFLRRVHLLILRKYPQLKHLTLPQIVLRLWIKLNKNDPETAKRAQDLLDDVNVARAAEPDEPDQKELF